MELDSRKIKRKEWRKLLKKKRRKTIRQKRARERDRIQDALEKEKQRDPKYQAYQAELERLDEELRGREEREQALRNALWLEKERKAQQEFEVGRQKQEAEEQEKREKRDRIRREFEEKERKHQEAIAERKRQVEATKRAWQERQQMFQQFVATGIADYVAELQTPHNTRPGTEDCQFFSKTGCCRHGLRCSGNHSTPGLSKTLLIANFYSHPALDRSEHSEYGNDGQLEFNEEELATHFADFFRDVIVEFETFGKIRLAIVCRNFMQHLRGNMYIEYEQLRNAAAAYQRMNGRFYAKKQLHVDFRHDFSWPSAVCGLAEANRCQKGHRCNFLHVFKNRDPRYRYNHYREIGSVHQSQLQHRLNTPLITKSWDEVLEPSIRQRSANWRWSETPEVDRRPSEVAVRQRSRNKSAERDRKSSRRKHSKKHRSRRSSKSPERSSRRSSRSSRHR